MGAPRLPLLARCSFARARPPPPIGPISSDMVGMGGGSGTESRGTEGNHEEKVKFTPGGFKRMAATSPKMRMDNAAEQLVMAR